MATQPNSNNLNLLASLLGPTPFQSFLIPGIILAVVVGGTNLLALIFNIRHQDKRYTWALAGGINHGLDTCAGDTDTGCKLAAFSFFQMRLDHHFVIPQLKSKTEIQTNSYVMCHYER